MTLVWMLVSIVGGHVIESGMSFPDAEACFSEAARQQVIAQKAADTATILAHEQNYRAEPERILLSCVPKATP
ncbi:MAG: hypothetical protein NXI19_05485 [Alphaproteobacteria bacterium]|nr:hypothetical protein [Alphaproteobacteria bacterium]